MRCLSGVSLPTFPDLSFITPWAHETKRAFTTADRSVSEPSWAEQKCLTRLTRVVDVRGYIHHHFSLGQVDGRIRRAHPIHALPSPDVRRVPSLKGVQACRAHPGVQGASGGLRS